MRYAQAQADAAMGKVKQSTERFEEVAKLIAASGDSEAAAIRWRAIHLFGLFLNP